MVRFRVTKEEVCAAKHVSDSRLEKQRFPFKGGIRRREQNRKGESLRRWTINRLDIVDNIQNYVYETD